MNPICDAIRNKQYLSFSYNGHQRIVIPATHGTSTAGNELLRAYQTEGTSESGNLGWKLFSVNDAQNLQMLSQAFQQNPEGYQHNDKAMGSIHCELA